MSVTGERRRDDDASMSSRSDAFRIVVEVHLAALVRLAHALGGDWNAAEDCVADAFARVWPRWSRGQVLGIDHYLRRAVINEPASWHRWRFRERSRLARLPRVTDQASPFDEQVTEVDSLRRAVLALPFRQRQVVVLRYLEDRPEAEVADLLGIPVGMIKSRLSRAMVVFRSSLVSGAEQ